MERIFVTTIGYMRERWQLAFPAARLVSTIAEVDGLNSSVATSLWLDIGVIAPESRLQSIRCRIVSGMAGRRHDRGAKGGRGLRRT